jgi:hypothetical protein
MGLSNDNNDYGWIALDGTNPDPIPVTKGGSLAIHNPTGNGTIYLGDSNVDTTGVNKGFPIPAGTGISLDVLSSNMWYIKGTAAEEVAWMVY